MVIQTPQITPDQMRELTNGLAQLQDFRLLFYVLIILLIASWIERWWAGHAMRREREGLLTTLAAERAQMSKERESMWAVSDKFTEAAKGWKDQTDKIVVELQVMRALNARTESTSGRG